MYNERLEMRGMKRKEIIEYFKSLNERFVEPNQFYGDGWNVIVYDEAQVRLGAFYIPSTVVEFSGDKPETEKAIADFRLKFLTAGG